MARAAVPGGLTARRAWRLGVLVDRWPETNTAYTLVFEVEDWPGHLAGQHVDLRLTAEDGYQASRSYSLAAPADRDHIQITIQRLDDGEVSPFLTDELTIGDELEVRGPLGGWFVWRPQDPGPVLLVGGGSGIVPLMAMVRARAGVSPAPFRLLSSVRRPEDRIYAEELRRRAAEDPRLYVTWLYTREGLEDDPRKPGRLRAEDLMTHGWPADLEPTCYVCGPTSFVEAAASLLLAAGHDPARVRTERFGGV
jgi:ferredoxin-NADP reductase